MEAPYRLRRGGFVEEYLLSSRLGRPGSVVSSPRGVCPPLANFMHFICIFGAFWGTEVQLSVSSTKNTSLTLSSTTAQVIVTAYRNSSISSCTSSGSNWFFPSHRRELSVIANVRFTSLHYLRWRMPPFMRQCWGLPHRVAQCTKPQGWGKLG